MCNSLHFPKFLRSVPAFHHRWIRNHGWNIKIKCQKFEWDLASVIRDLARFLKLLHVFLFIGKKEKTKNHSKSYKSSWELQQRQRIFLRQRRHFVVFSKTIRYNVPFHSLLLNDVNLSEDKKLSIISWWSKMYPRKDLGLPVVWKNDMWSRRSQKGDGF